MTGETSMSLADAGRIKRQTVQTAHHLVECSRKWMLRACDRIRGTAGCCHLDRRYGWTCSCNVNDDRKRRRPGGRDTWKELVQIRRRQTIQHSVCHERQFKVDPFRQAQTVQQGLERLGLVSIPSLQSLVLVSVSASYVSFTALQCITASTSDTWS